MQITDTNVITLLTGHEIISGLFDNGKTERWFFMDPYFRNIFFTKDNPFWDDEWQEDPYRWLDSYHHREAGKTTAQKIKKILCDQGLLDAYKIH